MLIYIPVYFWDNALWIGLREVENAADTQIGLIQTDGKTLIFPHTHDRNVDEDKSNEIQGVFFAGPPPEKLKYGKPRLGEVTCI